MDKTLHTSTWELLRDEISRLNAQFAHSSPEKVLEYVFNHDEAYKVAVVSSFGAESAVLLSLIADINNNVVIFFFDTLKHFEETLSYIKILEERLNLTNIYIVKPREGDIHADDPAGDLHMRDVDRCCHIRKTLPMIRALNPYKCWITGRKRFQNDTRTQLEVFEHQDRWIKVNPLAFWSSDQILAHAKARDLPPHPLVRKGFPSIGCQPCTSAVAPGSDPRSGRWKGHEKTECGIHFVDGKAVRNARSNN